MSSLAVSLLTLKCNNFLNKCTSEDFIDLIREENKLNNSIFKAWKFSYFTEIDYFNETWGSLKIFPISNDASGWFTVSVIIRDSSGNIFREKNVEYLYISKECGGNIISNIINHMELLNKSNDILCNGNFHLELLVQIKNITNDNFFKPKAPYSKHIFRSLQSGEFSDVQFEVEGNIFDAHKVMVSAHSEVLAECCRQCNSSGDPITLRGISSESFQTILNYIYCGGAPESDEYIKRHGKEIIAAANMYGVLDFKMIIETFLVGNRVIDRSNAAEYLVFADAHCCALLKEYALNYIVARGRDLGHPEYFVELNESPALLREVCAKLAEQCRCDNLALSRIESVNRLRGRLDQKNLDVHGTKEVLISSLRESKKRKLNHDEGI
ncbi:hypothetical protein ACHAXS_007033 [Conticribra weissflogii]